MPRDAQNRLLPHVACALLILGCTGLAYSNSFDAGFVYDDFQNFVDNPAVHWFELQPEAIREGIFAGPTRRPVAIFTYGLNYYFGRLDVTGYHVFNFAVHAANALTVYALLFLTAGLVANRTGSNGNESSGEPPNQRLHIAGALLGALFFALHPLQTQSVTYVVQRMTSMAAGFSLAALCLYIVAVRESRGIRRALGWLGVGTLYLLGVGSKEIAAPLPYGIWLYEWVIGQRADLAWARRRVLWLVPPTLVAIAGFVWLYGGLQAEFATRDFTMSERALTQLRVVIYYASLVLLPLPSRQNLLQLTPTSHSLLDPLTTLLSAVGLVTLLGFALWLAPRRPLSAFGILWFFLFLALESSVLPLEMIYEHRTYLPLFGACTILLDALLAIPERHRGSAIGAGAALVFALGCLSWMRNDVWREPGRIWADVYAKNGDDRALLSVGWAVEGRGLRLAAQGRNRDALVHYRQAAQIAPHYARNYRSWGESLIALGRMDPAITRFRKAVELDPEGWASWDGLTLALAQQNRMPEAVTAYREVVARAKHTEDLVRTPRSLIDRSEGLRAIELLEIAVRARPNDLELRRELLRILMRAGEYETAVIHARALLGHSPSGQLHGQLGLALWELGHAGQAIEQFEAALALEPEDERHRANLAWMLASTTEASVADPARALAIARELLEVDPTDIDLLETAATALGRLGRRTDAIGQLDRALDIVGTTAPATAERLESRRAELLSD